MTENRERRRDWHNDAFFGIHYDLHAADTDTELGRELTVEHLVERLRRVQPDWIQCDCKGHRGFTSWPTTIGYTSPGVINDSLQIHREATRILGIPLGMHYSGVWDTEAIVHHPEWARIDENGVPDGLETTRIVSTSRLSNYATDYMIPQMLELIDTYDVDGFWVDGENWAAKPDWSEACIAEFTQRTGIGDIPRSPSDPHWRDWIDFHRDLFVEHVTTYTNAIHERKPECMVASNWMYTMRQPEPLAAPVDYLSGDFEFKWGTDRAAVEGRLLDSRDKSWDLMAWGFIKAGEHMDAAPWIFKSATQLAQEVSQCIALGGGVMIYDQPQRSGHLTDWHQDTIGEVARFARARQDTCFKSTSKSEVAILHPYTDYYAKNSGLFGIADVNLPLEGALHSLLETQRSVDVVTEDAFIRHADRYRLLVIPERSAIAVETRNAIDVFLNRGGHLIVSGPTASSDFPEWTGCSPASELREEHQYLPVDQRAVGVTGPWQPVDPGADATVLTSLLKQQEVAKDATTNAVVIRNQVGAGTVTSIHGNIYREYHYGHSPLLRSFLRSVVDALGIDWTVTVKAPPALEVVCREKDGKLAINLLNRGAAEALSPRRPQIDDITPIDRVRITVNMPKPPRSVTMMPSADPVNWTWANGQLNIEVSSVRIHDVVVVE